MKGDVVADKTNCFFCQIVAGQSPASVFYEDDIVLGLMTIGPINKGHAMVIPKRHAAALADLDDAMGRQMWSVAQRTAAAIRASGLRCEGVNLFLADGEAALQDVFHVHLHIIPRFVGDPFTITVDWGDEPTRSELDEVAAQIQSALPGAPDID